MAPKCFPHLLGIDDAPFCKGQHEPVPIVGVMMEGAARVEAVATLTFPVDGDNATGILAEWIQSRRFFPTMQAVVLGGITIAGLGLVELETLAAALGLPVLAVTRRPGITADLARAMQVAGFPDRAEKLLRQPPQERFGVGLWCSFAGVDRPAAENFLRNSLGKAALPEALRVAHLMAAALVHGQSRGRC